MMPSARIPVSSVDPLCNLLGQINYKSAENSVTVTTPAESNTQRGDPKFHGVELPHSGDIRVHV